jgi:uncharacterized protein (TIGR02996 family)
VTARGRLLPRGERAFSRARPGGIATLESMSAADDDVETVSFDTSPTGSFGLQGVTRPVGEITAVRAQGTPPSLEAEAEAAWSAHDGPTVERRPGGGGPSAGNAPLDRDATERGLLAAIAAGDEGSRLVYADWLEERSEHARAGFLRIEQVVARLAPDDPRLDACTRQLRELMQHIDPGWRARVARPPIEGCPLFELRCPRRWDALAPTAREDVRHCGACARDVYYFESVDEAREAARAGHCVAIDLGSERWEDDFADIGTRCPGCSRRIVSSARYCPHCGEALRRSTAQQVLVTMGRMRIDD